MNMKTPCEDIRPLLIDYHDKALPADKEQLVREHIRECPSCKQEIEQLSVLFNDLKDLPHEEPGPGLREDFYAMLNHEVEQHEARPSGKKPIRTITFPRIAFRVAAAMALLITGLAAGLLIPRGENPDSGEMAMLKDEVDQLKKTVVLARLGQQSPSQRILAASSVQEFGTADESIIDALISTMETDENTNVRMSAMHALFRYRDVPRVREALVEGLDVQTDPVLQITLINMMVEMQEERAVEYMERILKQDETLPAVKEMAEKGLESIKA